MLKNAYFSHLFRHFWPKIFFFKNPASSVFWNHRKLPWCQKSEKTMEWLERNPSGRTYVRTYVRGQIYRTSQILGGGPKINFESYQLKYYPFSKIQSIMAFLKVLAILSRIFRWPYWIFGILGRKMCFCPKKSCSIWDSQKKMRP